MPAYHWSGGTSNQLVSRHQKYTRERENVARTLNQSQLLGHIGIKLLSKITLIFTS